MKREQLMNSHKPTDSIMTAGRTIRQGSEARLFFPPYDGKKGESTEVIVTAEVIWEVRYRSRAKDSDLGAKTWVESRVTEVLEKREGDIEEGEPLLLPASVFKKSTVKRDANGNVKRDLQI